MNQATTPRLEDMPDLLTVEELARFLRVNRNTVYGAIQAGLIHHVRLGRAIRVPKAAVERLLQEGVRHGGDAA